METFTVEDYLSTLAEIGWIDALHGWAQEPRARPQKKYREKKNTALPSAKLFLELAVTSFDTECIQGEGDYAAIIQALADASFGLFAPENISDAFDPSAGEARVSFEVEGKKRSLTVPLESDWFDLHVIEKRSWSIARSQRSG